MKNLNIPKEILELDSDKVSIRQKVVLAAIHHLTKEISNVTVTIKELVEYSGVSRNTIIDSLKLFKQYDWISFRKEGDSYIIMQNNTYKMNRDLSLSKISKREQSDIYNNKTANSLHIDRRVLDNKKLTLVDKMVISYLTSFSRHNKECFVKSTNICEYLNISDIAYKKSLAKLNKLGLLDIEVERKNGKIKGRRIKADFVEVINCYEAYIKSVETAGINNANIERAKIEQANVEKIENATVIVNALPNQVLESLSEEDLDKLYFMYKKQLDEVKIAKNKKVLSNT